MFNRIRLIEIMDQKGISAYKLWKLSGVSQSTISDILNKEDKNPTTKTLQKIADALKVSIDELFKEDSTENSHTENNAEINSLELIPEHFDDAEPARTYVKKHKIFASEGFNADKLTDKEILDFANALLEQMRLVSYKYKK
jgi:transcriptional regulator with XRE-family HTH domain